MKKNFIFSIFLMIGMILSVYGTEKTPETRQPEKEQPPLRVLMIGNSFSICVGNNLPQMAASVPGCPLDLTSAYIGGCSLQTHWNNIEKAEKDASFKPYLISRWFNGKLEKDHGNVNTLLKNRQWDIITIQQASHFSWRFETFDPYAGNLIAYIRKYAPDAEILIQQTWAYRLDDRRLKEWNITQKQMFEKLNDAYSKLAQKYQLRVIPTGLAVETVRNNSKKTFEIPDQETMNSLIYPDLPNQSNDVVGVFKWRKNSKTNEMYISRDSFHLNYRGEYLQGALWFSFLFNRKTQDIDFIPENMGKTDAVFLLKCAQEALDTYQQ